MKEILIPIRELQPVEPPYLFEENMSTMFANMLKQHGPWQIVTAVSLEGGIFLPDGHTRTIKNALAGWESQYVRLLENEEDRVKYGEGLTLSQTTLDKTRQLASQRIKELRERRIFSVYDYPIMKYRNVILEMAGMKR